MALALWRGEPYGDWPDAPFAEAERRRLTALRAAAESDLGRARELLARRPRHRGRRPGRRGQAAWPPAAPAVVVLDGAAALGARDRYPDARRADAVPPPAPPDAGASPARRQSMLLGGLVAAVVVAIVAARLSARSDANAEQAATAAEANHLAALSATEPQLDVSMLLAAEAFRLADTPSTRRGLTAALDGHARVERVVSFGGVPQDAVLSGGPHGDLRHRRRHRWRGRSVPRPLPRMLADLPGEWGAVTVVAPSPVDELLLLAGVYPRGAPWLRTVSTLDGTSRLLLEGDQVGGRPVDGAVTADGRRLLLVVAEPAGAVHDATRWHIVEVAVADGTPRDTGIGGSPRCRSSGCAPTSPTTQLRRRLGRHREGAGDARAAGRRPADPDPGAPAPHAELRLPGSSRRRRPALGGRRGHPGRRRRDDGRGARVPQEAVRDIAVSPDGRGP